MWYLLLAYIVVFALIAIAIFVVEIFSAPDDRDTWHGTLLDAIATGIFLLGMIFLATAQTDPILKRTWIVLAPAAAVYFVCSSTIGRSNYLNENPDEATSSDVAVTDIGTLLFILPAFILNLVFVFSVP